MTTSLNMDLLSTNSLNSTSQEMISIASKKPLKSTTHGYSWELALVTISEANCSDHWTKKSKRHKQQQQLLRLSFKKYAEGVTIPCWVTFTRLAPRILDEDNNISAFKFLRDELSECLIPEKRKSYISKKGKVIAIKGRADSDPRIQWRYKQEKSKIMGIRIQIEPLLDPHSANIPHVDCLSDIENLPTLTG